MKTKDQRDLAEILSLTKEAEQDAYSLFSRRLDTRRNVESFIALRDAFNLLKDAAALLQQAVDGATESRASGDLSVMDEIMVRSGRISMVENEEAEPGGGRSDSLLEGAEILEFSKK